MKLPSLENLILGLLSKVAPDRAAQWKRQIDFVREHYRRDMKREPNLFNPSRFSEKVQWQKLFSTASPFYTRLSDKIAVRSYVEEKGFASMVIPPLWVGSDPNSIPFDDLPRPFALKSSHASGHIIMVHPDQTIDRDDIIRQTREWLTYCHGTAIVEPGYLDVPHRLLVEPLLVCSDGEPPAELKVFVFDGVARLAQYLKITRDRVHRAAYLDRNGNQYPWRGRNPPLICSEKPALYDLALAVAGKLCKNMDQCRVDFYLKDDQLFIGEMTLYSFSGMVTVEPEQGDIIMGSFWSLRWPRTRATIAMLSRRWGRA